MKLILSIFAVAGLAVSTAFAGDDAKVEPVKAEDKTEAVKPADEAKPAEAKPADETKPAEKADEKKAEE